MRMYLHTNFFFWQVRERTPGKAHRESPAMDPMTWPPQIPWVVCLIGERGQNSADGYCTYFRATEL